jgi:hypothetical protein
MTCAVDRVLRDARREVVLMIGSKVEIELEMTAGVLEVVMGPDIFRP